MQYFSTECWTILAIHEQLPCVTPNSICRIKIQVVYTFFENEFEKESLEKLHNRSKTPLSIKIF